ncbi:proton-conducting transporter membrane subunit [Anaeromyxobacter sp. Fw109-5]|uniref:proton-conducting transporter transmembrane domain-containing protein n=1 Tax=Anaeromyxobacter sp. (strain Fw109-5) TaxID=404589 RepID=UPI0000ED6FA0|nr:proton-conducting transporter membrane subunit [Anaeromyxobacter sp. Fw109-5]ABS27963.1 NADH dehydrogenase (quinone) [Anaeromyxobacter sp. Fw109-5]
MLFVIVAPLALAVVALAIPSNRRRPVALLAGALVHAAGIAVLFGAPPPARAGAWLAFDPLAKVALLTTTALFVAAAVYAQGYLARRDDRDNRIFVGGLLFLLSAMTTVALSQHLGLSWVAIEATTLASAPLIYFNHNARSLEATWKYLLICSLGIALALLGTFFLALSGAGPGGPRSLLLEDLLAAGPSLSRPWVRAAFVFLLVGYGTKMGLAPLHSWKPDAYGEAPGLLGALLAGGLTNFAFLAIVRVFQVTRAAGDEAFARDALVGLGLLSIGLAAVFVVGQRDFKRMLAYSSVEHMGILALGVGLGGAAAGGAFFHSMNNGLTKGVLFLTAGNIHRAFGAKTTDEVRGAARRLPVSGPLFLAGFLAITGSPPFSPFFSEFAILNGAFGEGRFVVGGLFLALLAVIFVGMATTVLAVVQGDPGDAPPVPNSGDSWLTAAPPFALMALVLLLGLFLPEGLRDLFGAAARLVGGRWE